MSFEDVALLSREIAPNDFSFTKHGKARAILIALEAEPVRFCAKCGFDKTVENSDGEDECAFCGQNKLWYEEWE